MIPRSRKTLPDGRTLSYLDLGDPAGIPCLFTIGSPSTAVGGIAFADAARRAGIRLISVDKPGYGGSTRVPRRHLQAYGEDLRDLADALGLRNFALIGQSGGGPHALAAAHILRRRVSSLCLLSSFGPVTEAWAAQGVNPFIKCISWIARKAPPLLVLPIALLRLSSGDAERTARMVKRRAPKMNAHQRAAVEDPNATFIFKGLEEAFADGLGAASDEFHALSIPWTFNLRDIEVSTDLWHGTEDESCPIGMARGLAERLPHAKLHELEGLGHGFFSAELDAAMRVIRDKHIKAFA